MGHKASVFIIDEAEFFENSHRWAAARPGSVELQREAVMIIEAAMPAIIFLFVGVSLYMIIRGRRERARRAAESEQS